MIFPGKLTEMAAFYAERARGGVGLIVTGMSLYILFINNFNNNIDINRWHSTQ